MSFKVFVTHFFEKKFRSLSRKYPKLPLDLKDLIDEIENNPGAGERLKGCKGPVYKIRMGSRDMKKGKSGAFRIIYFLKIQENLIYLLTLYPKSERETIHTIEINKILKELGFVEA